MKGTAQRLDHFRHAQKPGGGSGEGPGAGSAAIWDEMIRGICWLRNAVPSSIVGYPFVSQSETLNIIAELSSR